MKTFALDDHMLTMRGVFYPTGHVVLMFPSEADARNANDKLSVAGLAGEDIALLTPQDVQETIARTVGDADIPLPSAGTEADTVRRFTELASQGHYGLMVHAPDAKDSDRVMDLLKGCAISYGQKYRQLVIEDLVD